MSLGGPELLILVIVAVLVFGAGWLPKAARNLGKAKVEFDDAQRQFAETKQSVIEATGVQDIEKTVRKANQALNTSPQNLLKNAATSARNSAGAQPGDESGAAGTESAGNDAPAKPKAKGPNASTEPVPPTSETVNLDFSDDE